MYKLFLTLRYLRKRRIAYFAIAAVVLCTAMVLIVMSVMGGFLDQLKRKARGMLGDIVVDNQSYRGFPLYQEFIDEISRWPEIEQATPLIYSYAMLRFENSSQIRTVQVVGLRLAEVYIVNDFKQSLYYEAHYPGTTNLGEQQQPLLGYDTAASPRSRLDPDSLLPTLPEPFRSALAQSRAAGVTDEDFSDTHLNQVLAEDGLPLVPGVFALNRDAAGGPPTLAGDERPGLIIGRDLVAERLPDGRYKRSDLYPFRRGSLAFLTVVAVSDKATIDVPDVKAFRYADDSRTGIYEIDSKHAYCDFDLLQKLLRMNAAERVDPATGEVIGMLAARCSQSQIKIRPELAGRRVDPFAVARRLEERYHALNADPRFNLDLTDASAIAGVNVQTWEQSQARIIGPVEKERQLVTILFGIISLVAAVLVLCILYMIVLQKTRDIGIIKSLGGSSSGVACIFISYGAAVGVVGSVVGTFIGYWFVRKINEVQALLVALNPSWRVWDRSVYSFDEIPNTVRWEDIVIVIVCAILAATIGSLAAAWRAGAMQPVEALRHE